MVVKNLIGRYRNSLLGFGWHFVMPIITMAVYYVVFTQIRVNEIRDFWIYLASGIFAFHFMINNLVGGASCIVANSGMVKKMYFPREILVLSQVLSTFIVMVIGYLFVFGTMMGTGYEIKVSLVFIIPFFVLTLMFVTGYCLLFSSLTVYLRDVQYVLGSISIIFFFLTPMFFTTDSTTGLLNTIVWANPFTYYVEFLHDIIYYGSTPDVAIVIMCTIISITSLLVGMLVFRKLRGGFAERL